MESVPYRALARLSDWYHGWRDGVAGLPPRSAPERPVVANPPTTPHREYLIRLGQDAFAHERLRLQERRRPLHAELERATAELERAREEHAVRTAALAEASQPLTPADAERRRQGEAHQDLAVIRRRRRREHERGRERAAAQETAAREAVAAAEGEREAVERRLERERETARIRVELVHQHLHRRMASYRRKLVHTHPHGVWVNDQMGFERPEIPGWAEARSVLEPQPSEPRREAPSEPPPLVELKTLPLGDHTVLGSEAPPADAIVPGEDIAPRHCSITRVGDAFRLKTYGRGSPVFIEGRPVRSVVLEPGAHFDLAGFRYEFTADSKALRRYSLRCDLVVSDLSAQSGGRPRLTRMSVVLRERSVLVVLGPSGAGKTSLFAALMGELRSESGELYFRGQRLGDGTDQIRHMLGFVPQGDDLHRTLKLRTLLDYADRLRRRGLGHRGDRAARIERVCAELRLTDQLDQVVDTLSGGQRKRASIAMEMMSDPDLLLLDEPTSGLDPGMDREVMSNLRHYADPEDGSPGRTVIVITHATEHLDPADQVVVVAAEGRPVYSGPPGRPLLDELGVESYADLMRLLSEEDTQSMTEEYAAGEAAAEAREEARRAAAEAARHRPPVGVRYRRFRDFAGQLPVLLSRQLSLVMTRGFTTNREQRTAPEWLRGVATAALPFVIAAVGAWLAATVSGSAGLGADEGPNRTAATALSLLVTLCVLAGQALTYGDVVAEYTIIQREYRTGTKPGAIMLAKWLVFAGIAIAQAAIVTAVYLVFKPGPDHANALGPVGELFTDLAMTSVAAMSMGLLVSALARKLEQAVAVATGTAIFQVVLNGVSADLTDRWFLNAASGLLPARWGLAATASSIDLRGIANTHPDELWAHTAGQWLFDLAALGVLTVGCFVLATAALARRLRSAG